MKKISFNVDAVAPRWAQVTKLVNVKTTLPILTNVLVEVTANATDMILTASDQESWLSVKAPMMTDADGDVRLCINAFDFNNALNNLRGMDIEMLIDEERHTVTCNYKNGHFALPFEDAVTYPRPENNGGEEGMIKKRFDAQRLVGAIGRVGFATANDELRPVLTGIHFDLTQQGVVVVTSDAHKLAKYMDSGLEGLSDGEADVIGFTIPKKPSASLINIIGNSDGDVKIAFNQRAMVVGNGEFKLTTRLIDGRFPRYDSVIPQDNNIVTKVAKEDMMDALKRILPMSDMSLELVRMTFDNGQVTLMAADQDCNKSASESIWCDYMGDAMTIGFNGTNIMTVLRSMPSDHICIRLKSPSHACVFCPSEDTENVEYLVVVMPTRI